MRLATLEIPSFRDRSDFFETERERGRPHLNRVTSVASNRLQPTIRACPYFSQQGQVRFSSPGKPENDTPHWDAARMGHTRKGFALEQISIENQRGNRVWCDYAVADKIAPVPNQRISPIRECPQSREYPHGPRSAGVVSTGPVVLHSALAKSDLSLMAQDRSCPDVNPKCLRSGGEQERQPAREPYISQQGTGSTLADRHCGIRPRPLARRARLEKSHLSPIEEKDRIGPRRQTDVQKRDAR